MCTISYFVDNLGTFSAVKMCLRICSGTVFKRDLTDVVSIIYSWCSCPYFQSNLFLGFGGSPLIQPKAGHSGRWCSVLPWWGSGDSCEKTQQSEMNCKVINFFNEVCAKKGGLVVMQTLSRLLATPLVFSPHLPQICLNSLLYPHWKIRLFRHCPFQWPPQK